MISPLSAEISDHRHQQLSRSLYPFSLEQNVFSSTERRKNLTTPRMELKSGPCILLLVATLLTQSLAFPIPHADSRPRRCIGVGSSSLTLVPLSFFGRDLSFFLEDDDYRLCIDEKGQFTEGEDTFFLALVEEEDLPDLSRFVVASFGADAIRLSEDISAFERALMSPAAEMLNSFSSIVAFAEVFSGTRERLGIRLEKMDVSAPTIGDVSTREATGVVEDDSLVLALARPSSDTESRIEVIASIELRLQPCDAKIPFSLPWLDRVERRLASTIGLGDRAPTDLQPYLSNLCVDEKFRGKNIGRALVRCVENIAKSTWGYNRVYLHVDEDNIAAMSLYKSEGYRDVGHRWNPFWAGRASEIAYYVKTLKSAKA